MTDQTAMGDAVPPDEWRHVRGQLTRHDRMLVMGATMRKEVVDRPDLTPAQLAYVRHRQHFFDRLPRLRLMILILYVVLALGEAYLAVSDHGSGRVVAVATAVLFALLAVVWAFSPSLRRGPEQMARLRQRIEQRDEG
jgi:hypothetical protein